MQFARMSEKNLAILVIIYANAISIAKLISALNYLNVDPITPISEDCQ